MAAIMRLTTGVVYVRSVSGTLATGAITSSGHLTFSPDNTYDIGASGATRPRNVYVAGDLIAPTAYTNTVIGPITFNGNTMYPMSDNYTSLGTAGSSWASSYVNTYTSRLTTGTLVTNDVQTVAVDAVVSLGSNALSGLYVVSASNGTNALFSVNGASQNVELVYSYQSGTYFSSTKDTASKVNVYWETDAYKLQNKTAGSISIRLIRLGV